MLFGILVMVSACSAQNQNTTDTKQKKLEKEDIKFEIVQTEKLKIEQIRGIGYPGNDDKLYIATDDGLKMYKDNQWFETTTGNHDYMGFQAVHDGFIASGAPQNDMNLKEKLGVVHSKDKGESLEHIAFYGQNQFYFIGTDYSGNGLYVINQEESKELSFGVNYSLDHGETWNESKLNNFKADSLGMIAVHPNSGETVAMSTRSGIYYSIDNGNTMNIITEPYMVTALTFLGDELLFSSVENDQIHLKKINPQSGELTAFTIPFLAYENPITFLAVNPKNPLQIAFTTYNNDLYESINGGKSWTNLFINGKKEAE